MYVALEKRIGLKAEYARTRTNPASLDCTYRIIYSPLIFSTHKNSGSWKRRVPLEPLTRMRASEGQSVCSVCFTASTSANQRAFFGTNGRKFSPTSYSSVSGMAHACSTTRRCSSAETSPNSRISPRMASLRGDAISAKLSRAAFMLVGLAL